jgi:vacuolar-type H+-ATPase subunit E/Vma4
MSPLATQDAALEPVRAAMLRRAAEQADRITGQARDSAQAVVAEARRVADAALAQARAEGDAQARPVAAAQLNRSRRAARSVALGARLAAHDEIAGRIRSAILRLRDEPGYPELRDRLARAAGQAAGPQAEVSEHPAGGVVARAGGVVVDCSLPRLADRVVEALGPRIAGLCGS